MKHIKLFEQFVNEAGIFNTRNELIGYELKKFMDAYKELHKDNQVIYDKKEDVSYGIRKGSKEAHWKYFHDDGEIYHSEKDRDVLGLINFKKMVMKNHPWSK
jgi:hypothetical protein